MADKGEKTKKTRRKGENYIEDSAKRSSAFSKRKKGIIEKLSELYKMTGAEVGIVLAASSGHVSTYASDKFQSLTESEEGRMFIMKCLRKDDEEPEVKQQKKKLKK